MWIKQAPYQRPYHDRSSAIEAILSLQRRWKIFCLFLFVNQERLNTSQELDERCDASVVIVAKNSISRPSINMSKSIVCLLVDRYINCTTSQLEICPQSCWWGGDVLKLWTLEPDEIPISNTDMEEHFGKMLDNYVYTLTTQVTIWRKTSPPYRRCNKAYVRKDHLDGRKDDKAIWVLFWSREKLGFRSSFSFWAEEYIVAYYSAISLFWTSFKL